jgi:hypothetical protein
MTNVILLSEVSDGDTIDVDGEGFRTVKTIEFSDQNMGECGDRDCCGVADYWDVNFTDGSYFWGHGNTPVDILTEAV